MRGTANRWMLGSSGWRYDRTAAPSTAMHGTGRGGWPGGEASAVFGRKGAGVAWVAQWVETGARKEARILELVRGRPEFMQGETVLDSAGNQLRILDYIRGKTLGQLALEMGKNHEDFFFNYYPALLDEFIQVIEAIRFLHENGEKHGDIRRDHIIKDMTTGRYRWIDFDFNYRHGESRFAYDLFGLGNILIYITGRGDVITHRLLQEDPDALGKLSDDDVNIVFRNRVANLGKIYPYIPEALNRVLMHFSVGARVYYDDTRELLEDLGEAREKITK